MLLSTWQRPLTSALRVRYRSRRTAWWLRDESLIPLADSMSDVIRDLRDVGPRAGMEILKPGRRKVVFRIRNVIRQPETLVAKVFFLDHLSHRLRYRRYGLDETVNLLRARKREIEVPTVYAYWHVKDGFGLVRASAFLMEDLSNHVPIGELLDLSPDSDRPAIFMRTIPLFTRLYEACCNHIDVNGGSVMVGAGRSDRDVVLLDFQHATFYRKPRLSILMFEAGYFARTCRKWISAETAGQWANRILDSVGIREPGRRLTAKAEFEYHLRGEGRTATQTTLSRRQRQKIGR